MASGFDKLFALSHQTPCDTLPVPQNLVFTRRNVDNADKPVTGGHAPSLNEDTVMEPAQSLASAMNLGQQTLFFHLES